MVAGPNLAVVDHTTGSTDARERIAGAGWDFVVLQQGPTPAGICVRTLAEAAHAASASWPPDPATAVQADTVHVASGGGPC
jgi:hypothetical protein